MKKSVRFVALLLSVVLVLALCQPALAAVTEDATTLRVGYMDYAGFIDPQSDGSFSGYGAEYLREISEYTGFRYEYVYGEWPDLLEMLAAGKLDLLCTAQYTPERAQLYDYSAYPIGYSQGLLYTRFENPDLCYEDFQQFDGMTVGTIANSAMNDLFTAYAQRNGFTVQFKTYNTEEQMLTALYDGAIDAMCSEHLSKHTGLSLLAMFGADAYYIISYKDSPYMESINAALQQIKTDIDFESNLFHKYYDNSTAATALQFTAAERAFIAQSGPIRVGLHSDRAPFSQYDANTGTFRGICVDILNQIAQRSGLTFEFVPQPLGAKTVDLLSTGDYDLSCGVERDNFITSETITPTDAFLESGIVPVAPSGVNIDLTRNITAAVPASFQALQKSLTSNYPNINLIFYNSNRACLDAVQAGEADIFIQNTHILSLLLQEPKYDGLDILPIQIMAEHTAMAVPNTQNPLLLSILNKSIASIDSAATTSTLIEHTFASPYRYTMADFLYKFRAQVIVISALVVACIALLAGMLIVRRRSELSLQKKNDLLRDAIAQAEHANAAKGQFLARMSHEMRTPMNAIVGMTTLARNKIENPQQTMDYLNKIDLSSKVLLNIINDVLDMSAIENDKLKVAYAPFDFKELLSGITTMYYSQCGTKGVEFQVSLTDVTEELLVGDSLRLNQILLNLLSNAYKFTPAGGHISLHVTQLSRREDKVYFEFTVADTGCGMDEDMLSRLFKPFEQESAITAQKHGGSGLGLSITKNLVDLMQGAIRAESKKGEGSTFTVNLPFGVCESERPNPSDIVKSIRALVVDDDKDTRDYTTTVLKRIGVEHDLASSGEEALQMLMQARSSGENYDVCFVDWKMPGMDGLDVIRHIRQLFDNDTVIIIVSAYDLSQVAGEAKDAGADLFVTKPLFQSTVFDALMSLSGGKFKLVSHEPGDYDFTGHRVLLAEDNELNREIAVELLQMVGLTVDTAEDGKIALDTFTASPEGTYDAILMDVQMPEMNGHESAQAIRASAHPQAQTVPIYAMTANAFTEDVSAALSSGMNGHIAKPIDTNILYRTLDEAFRRSGNSEQDA